MSKLEEYRGAKRWEGLHPAVEEPRAWDEGFRDFLLKCVTPSLFGSSLTARFRTTKLSLRHCVGHGVCGALLSNGVLALNPSPSRVLG